LTPNEAGAPDKTYTGWHVGKGRAAERGEKKNFAQKLSDALAPKVADALRPVFPNILPITGAASADGTLSKPIKGLESLASSLKGVKKLDVNFSTERLGLGIGVSVKTLNFRDKKSKRYTKNVSRIDNELRAEASDYHGRQPFAVLVGLVFLPMDSAFDFGAADASHSSFGHACQTYRFRTGRLGYAAPNAAPGELFEKIFIVLYEFDDPANLGNVVCFDVANPPPRRGLPAAESSLTLQQVMDETVRAFFLRNLPKKIWATEAGAGADVFTELEQLADAEDLEGDTDSESDDD
jgi:hypothetical protein